MLFREFVDSVQSIIAVADLVKNNSKDGTASMADFLYSLSNAGISMDYDKFKSVYDSEPELKNVIQQFDAENITFVGGKPDADAPVGDVPPEEKVGQMAKRAMNKREESISEAKLSKEQQEDLEDYIEELIWVTDPESDYDGRSPFEILDDIRSEFGDKIADDLENGMHMFHYPRRPLAKGTIGRDKLSRREPTRIAKSGKIDKRSALGKKNAIKWDMKYDSPKDPSRLPEAYGSQHLAAVAKQFDELKDANEHGKAAQLLVQTFGNELEQKLIKTINDVHDARGSIKDEEQNIRDHITSKYYKVLQNELAIQQGISRKITGERKLTKPEKSKMKKYEKSLPDADFKERYGARWKEVKYATATKMAKKNA